MRNLLAFLVGLCLALCCGVVFGSAPSCTNYELGSGAGNNNIGGVNLGGYGAPFQGTNKYSICNAAKTAMLARQEAANPAAMEFREKSGSFDYEYASGTYGSCRFSTEQRTDSLSPWGSVSTYTQPYENIGSVSCPEDSCAAAKELAEPVVVMGATSSGGELCGADDGSGGTYTGGDYGKGCKVIKRGAGISSAGGHWYGQVSYTGASCGGSVTPVNTSSTANCIATGGTSVCVSRTDAGKVTAGGEAVDARGVPDNGCTLMGNGGAMCESGAPDGPKDSGGVPLTPTATLSATAEPSGSTEGATSTINYYNETTVSSSYTIVTGSGGGSGDGSGEGGDSLDDLEGGDMEAVDGFGESAGGFWDRVEGSPLVSAVSGLSGSLTGGACPAWNETIEAGAFGTYELDFSFICGMWEDIAPVISAVMLAVFALAALRILMSA